MQPIFKNHPTQALPPTTITKKHHEIIRFLILPTINHQKISGRAVLFNLLQ